ncbi:MAG: hypothetical protein FJ000_06550 [Actinobacteria bacterium]|nr:hypothetical protein [Actinomycetota bacterium]
MAATMAAKLQIKPGQRLLVLHRPDGVVVDVPAAADAAAGDTVGEADAVLAFVTMSARVAERADAVLAAAKRDGLAWIAYPKAKRLGTDRNRDLLADLPADLGTRAVRRVSVDDTWSALRLRPPRPAG